MTANTRIAGRYRLKERVGTGGLGVLWAAVDERSGLSVAVRVLTRGVESSARVTHFRSSALAAARLNHPNIVSVLDEGVDPVMGPFIVTAWVDGWPLSAWRGGSPPWDFLAPVMAQICDALAYVHARDLLHLDLRPGNILVQRRSDGTPHVHLTDIGMARVDDGFSDQGVGPRTTLKYLGSVRYLPPEVADSPPWKLGPWSDLYGLGLTLWEMLAGSIPFADFEGVALLMRRASLEPPALPDGLGGAHHAALSVILDRLLARRPADRPRSAAQVRSTVESLTAPPRWVDPLPRAHPKRPSTDRVAARAAGRGIPQTS